MEAAPSIEPDCRRCAHYYITHNVKFLYGCRALGFRSRRLPMYEVIEASGAACLAFTPKKPPLRLPRS